MKANVRTKELRSALEKLALLPGRANGMSGNSVMTVEADEFGGLRCCRTTINAFARIGCPSADIEQGGTAVVPYLALAKAVKSLAGDDTSLRLTEQALFLNSGDNSDAEVFTWDPSEVLPPPPKLAGVEIALQHPELMSILKIAGIAAATDTSRPAYMGITFRKTNEGLSVFGLNGHRIHACRIAALLDRPINPEKDSERDTGVLLPNEGVDCAKSVFAEEEKACTVTIGREAVQFDLGNICLRLPTSEFHSPFIEMLMNPEAEIRWTIDRKSTLKAAQAVAPTSGDGAIVFAISPNAVEFRARDSSSKVRRIVACTSNGSGEYQIEGDYLKDMLAVCTEDTLRLSIAGRGQQLYYREGERDYLIMFRGGNKGPYTKQGKK